MEMAILDFIQKFANPFFDWFFKVYTTLGNHGEIWIVIMVLLLIKKETRKIALFAVAALLIEYVSVEYIIKPLIERPRPFIVNDTIQLIIPKPSGYSFPSGHSASSFAVGYFLYLNNLKYKKTYLVLASLMAFSRLYVYVHYPTDVIVGVLLGIAIAYGMYFIYKKSNKSGGKI